MFRFSVNWKGPYFIQLAVARRMDLSLLPRRHVL